MELIIYFIGILFLGVAVFYIVCHLIKLWTGCNDAEAVTRLHNFLNGKVQYQFYNDLAFANDVWENIKNVIGDKRFEQLRTLSHTVLAAEAPLLSFGENSGLPYVAISVYYADENEKQVLENLLTNLVRQYLQRYGYSQMTIADWKVRYDLKMPFLEIRYARTAEEKRILGICLQNTRQNVVSANTPVKDDTEGDDLDE